MWNSGMRFRERRSDRSEDRPPERHRSIWGLGTSMVAIFFMIALAKIGERSPDEAVQLVGILAVCAALVIPFALYFRYKQQKDQQQAQITPSKDPKEEAKSK